MLIQLNELCLLTQKQLGKEQQVNLLAFKQLMQCKLLLVESRAAEAHLKLLESLSYFYDIPTQMPIALLKQALPLLAFFGEFSIRRQSSPDHCVKKVGQKRYTAQTPQI
ncbi:hypothetical protein [Vibrio parahaemolyticus]|uniref:hypothetical protein n=1 Tax=Vibrio parahaemolyticus TaxID=670 RepID=UPI001F2D2B64|nr:hypothetical protein [Vibrio parahaemolyticus]